MANKLEEMKKDVQFWGMGIAEIENNQVKCTNYGYSNIETGEKAMENQSY